MLDLNECRGIHTEENHSVGVAGAIGRDHVKTPDPARLEVDLFGFDREAFGSRSGPRRLPFAPAPRTRRVLNAALPAGSVGALRPVVETTRSAPEAKPDVKDDNMIDGSLPRAELPPYSWPADLMTARQVAETVLLTPKTVRQHIRLGRLRAVR